MSNELDALIQNDNCIFAFETKNSKKGQKVFDLTSAISISATEINASTEHGNAITFYVDIPTKLEKILTSKESLPIIIKFSNLLNLLGLNGKYYSFFALKGLYPSKFNLIYYDSYKLIQSDVNYWVRRLNISNKHFYYEYSSAKVEIFWPKKLTFLDFSGNRVTGIHDTDKYYRYDDHVYTYNESLEAKNDPEPTNKCLSNNENIQKNKNIQNEKNVQIKEKNRKIVTIFKKIKNNLFK